MAPRRSKYSSPVLIHLLPLLNLLQEDTIVLSQSIVQQCLNSIGLGTRSRKQHFKDLLTSFDIQMDADTSLTKGQDNVTAPVHYEYLPRTFSNCTERVKCSSSDEDDAPSSTDGDRDRDDSLADWVYETELWSQVAVERP